MPEVLNKSINTRVPTNQGRHRPWWRILVEFFLLLPIAILFLECFFNWAGVGQEEFLEPDAILGVRHIPRQKIVWRLEGFSNESFNSQGLRDVEHSIVKPANVLRIALLGDSATEGLQVPLKDTYGVQVQDLLNNKLAKTGKRIEVINFACSSYSNGQEMLQIKHQVAQYKPDLIILMYNRGDYIENIRDPHSLRAEPRPYFYLSPDGKLLQDNAVMEANNAFFHPHPVLDFLRRNSRIYGVLSHMDLTLNLNEMLYYKLRNSLSKKLFGNTVPEQKTLAYPIQNVWKVTQTTISTANRESREIGSQFMLVCFPNNVNDRQYSIQIAELEKLSKQEGFGFIDLTPAYIFNKDPRSLFLKYHLSSQGHKVAAELIAPQAQQELKSKF